jgi:hypothetical protein
LLTNSRPVIIGVLPGCPSIRKFNQVVKVLCEAIRSPFLKGIVTPPNIFRKVVLEVSREAMESESAICHGGFLAQEIFKMKSVYQSLFFI